VMMCLLIHIHIIIQVELLALPTSYIKAFFANSKEAVRQAKADVNDSSPILRDESITSDRDKDDNQEHSQTIQRKSRSLSCLKLLLCCRV